MKIRVIESVNYAGREWKPGIYEASQAEAASLFSRGRVRPATQDEIASEMETATAAPVAETAARRPARRGGNTIGPG